MEILTHKGWTIVRDYDEALHEHKCCECGGTPTVIVDAGTRNPILWLACEDCRSEYMGCRDVARA